MISHRISTETPYNLRFFIGSISDNSFVNRDDFDFDNAESTAATQEWDLVEDTNGQVAEYSTRLEESYSLCLFFWSSKSAFLWRLTLFFFCRVAKFTSIRSLTLFFSHNFGGDTTKISFIGLKGEFSEVRKQTKFS